MSWVLAGLASGVLVVRTYGEGVALSSHVASVSEGTLRVNITKGAAGCNPAIKSGTEVDFTYSGHILSGDPPQVERQYVFGDVTNPISATIGKGQLIEGLEAGLIALCAQDRAGLIIPAECELPPCAFCRKHRTLCECVCVDDRLYLPACDALTDAPSPSRSGLRATGSWRHDTSGRHAPNRCQRLRDPIADRSNGGSGHV